MLLSRSRRSPRPSLQSLTPILSPERGMHRIEEQERHRTPRLRRERARRESYCAFLLGMCRARLRTGAGPRRRRVPLKHSRVLAPGSRTFTIARRSRGFAARPRCSNRGNSRKGPQPPEDPGLRLERRWGRLPRKQESRSTLRDDKQIVDRTTQRQVFDCALRHATDHSHDPCNRVFVPGHRAVWCQNSIDVYAARA